MTPRMVASDLTHMLSGATWMIVSRPSSRAGGPGLSSHWRSEGRRENSIASKGRSVVTICHTMSWSMSS